MRSSCSLPFVDAALDICSRTLCVCARTSVPGENCLSAGILEHCASEPPPGSGRHLIPGRSSNPRAKERRSQAHLDWQPQRTLKNAPRGEGVWGRPSQHDGLLVQVLFNVSQMVLNASRCLRKNEAGRRCNPVEGSAGCRAEFRVTTGPKRASGG